LWRAITIGRAELPDYASATLWILDQLDSSRKRRGLAGWRASSRDGRFGIVEQEERWRVTE